MSCFSSAKNAVLFIAEVGGNHEGDLGALRRLHGLALTSGADVVKYQLYTGDTLVSHIESPDRNAHFKKFEIPSSRNIKKALNDDQLELLLKHIPKTALQSKAYDFWVLSYLCNGMNMTDILHLKKAYFFCKNAFMIFYILINPV